MIVGRVKFEADLYSQRHPTSHPWPQIWGHLHELFEKIWPWYIAIISISRVHLLVLLQFGTFLQLVPVYKVINAVRQAVTNGYLAALVGKPIRAMLIGSNWGRWVVRGGREFSSLSHLCVNWFDKKLIEHSIEYEVSINCTYFSPAVGLSEHWSPVWEKWYKWSNLEVNSVDLFWEILW